MTVDIFANPQAIFASEKLQVRDAAAWAELVASVAERGVHANEHFGFVVKKTQLIQHAIKKGVTVDADLVQHADQIAQTFHGSLSGNYVEMVSGSVNRHWVHSAVPERLKAHADAKVRDEVRRYYERLPRSKRPSYAAHMTNGEYKAWCNDTWPTSDPRLIDRRRRAQQVRQAKVATL
ncbi:MAG TPA: hypothetical protein VFR09_07730 [Alphaproteobacteria bacterium]|nr:hypothetical protein [Alphaproteobacteria bacterium]